ncbi:MAG: hypothetical protein ACREQM_17000 [Candidatus Dormibacteraceae bacterium]
MDLFRHSFITEQLPRGMNPFQLAQIVDQSDTTMIARPSGSNQSHEAV